MISTSRGAEPLGRSINTCLEREAAGVPVWHDGIRVADDQNPHRYYGLKRVKDLNKTLDKGWVRDGRGRAMKR